MATDANEIPKTLYHTTLCVIDYHHDASGGTRSVYVLGSHATLESAKAFTLKALQELGYDKDEFETYSERPADGEWNHGDGVLVYAKAPAGQVFLVGIDTKPNFEMLLAKPDGSLEMPAGQDHFHYVLQTRIDYNKDRTGAAQRTEIEGSYLKRSDAFEAARKCLAKEDFAQYEERESTDTVGKWDYGEDVLVHAVMPNGENFQVAVRTVPGAHKRHGKKQ
jgi:hypothetical protein